MKSSGQGKLLAQVGRNRQSIRNKEASRVQKNQQIQYPKRFGQYILISPLAQGGMGELHLAISGQADLKKLCVIKQIITELADQEFVARFLDEAKVTVKLGHQNLVPIFEAGVLDGHYFMAMEHIDGRDLRAIWNKMEEKEFKCPPEIALHITKELCRGLSYAHSFRDLQLIHRDISPPNILISFSGEVRITDFGLATSSLKAQKTAPGVLYGKLAYLAPEQAKNETLSPRTDIYSAGIILWELLTGERFFNKEGTQLEKLKRAAEPNYRAPSSINSNLPAEVDFITRKAMQIDPDERYENAEEMRKDVAELLASLHPTLDTPDVALFLAKLFGKEIQQGRQKREKLIDRLLPQIVELQRSDEDITQQISQSENDKASLILSSDENLEFEAILPQGTMLRDRYRVEDLIREGGMGMVYRATHTGIDKCVAVKVLHPLYSKMPDVVSRFQQEAKAASRIGHPNIIEIFDSGSTQNGAAFFAMEYLEGDDLAQLLKKGPLEINRAIEIAYQVALGVGAAHQEQIIHRDLKPENIYLTQKDGELSVKVLDFGIAQGPQDEESRERRLTNPGMAMGTPEYMSPEQAAGGACDHRTDIYALGAILYEMLVGKPPHDGNNVLAVLSAKASGVIPSIKKLRPEIPEALAELVTIALSIDIDDRPSNMEAFAKNLEAIKNNRSDLNSHTPHTQKNKSFLWLAAFLPFLIAISYWIFSLKKETPQTQPKIQQKSRGHSNAAQKDKMKNPVAASLQKQSAPTTLPASAPTEDTHAAQIQNILKEAKEHLHQGQFRLAHQRFSSLLNDKKNRNSALLGLAEVAFQQGRYRQAMRYAKEAVNTQGSWKAELALANYRYKLKKYHLAEKGYRRVLRFYPKNKEAQRGLERTLAILKPL